ncbi:hypothetical protein HID58_024374 [Brassica napus]|uniref:Uncharacterized protein n=1 Tax=Brassica napus TaxID=3708 RepID=A0ABQ8D4X3_BRANA|nr:hypothetical protein HID58_024374 [Brassica napus]
MTPSFNARPKQSKATRPPPLELPSAVAHRPPQRRDVASRYLEPTSSSSSSLLQSSPYSTAKRCESPNVTRTNRPATPSSSVATNRPQSTGRRQPVTLSRGGGGAAERMLLTSGRSLFASFQANENISKLYPSPPPKSNLSDQWPRSSLQPNCLNSTTMIPKLEQITRPWMFGMTPSARGASIARGLSPSRGISPSGRMVSPLRVRKKEKSRENGGVADDAHVLKLLHNRLLQWRFANARASPVFSAQKMTTEKRLYNSRISISKLYDSVRAKRIETQRLKLNLKLIFILNRQMGNLEEWLVVERDYVSSLVGAAEGLKGSTLCLPVDCVAKVNGQSVKDAISSAVDVMQAMASSICMLLPKVEKISCLAADLARVNIKEQEMLDVSRELLNTISALQVKECSLETQAMQLHH